MLPWKPKGESVPKERNGTVKIGRNMQRLRKSKKGKWLRLAQVGLELTWGKRKKMLLFHLFSDTTSPRYNSLPLSPGDTLQDPRGCLKSRTVPKPIYTVLIPIHTYV